MPTVVELEIPAERLGLARTFESIPTFEFQLGAVFGNVPPLVWTIGASYEEIHDALDGDPSVSVIASVEASYGQFWLFRLEFGSDLPVFKRIVADDDGAIIDAWGRDGIWGVKLLFHDRRSVSTCHSQLCSHEFESTVSRIGEMSDPGTTDTALTETQYETMLMAHELGYFDVPRKITLEELAKELGISHQALSERLRRSHAALVRSQLSSSGTPLAIGP